MIFTCKPDHVITLLKAFKALSDLEWNLRSLLWLRRPCTVASANLLGLVYQPPSCHHSKLCWLYFPSFNAPSSFLLPGFALAVPCAWNVLPPDNCMLPHHRIWFSSMSLSKKPFRTTLFSYLRSTYQNLQLGWFFSCAHYLISPQ